MSEYGVLALIHRLLASPAGCGLSIHGSVSPRPYLIVHTLQSVPNPNALRTLHITLLTPHIDETTTAAAEAYCFVSECPRHAGWGRLVYAYSKVRRIKIKFSVVSVTFSTTRNFRANFIYIGSVVKLPQ